MYGSIRKNYNKMSNFFERSTLKESKIAKSFAKEDDLQETRYLKIDDVRKESKKTEIKKSVPTQYHFKQEFPIASIMLTIVSTMLVMVVAFGFGA